MIYNNTDILSTSKGVKYYKAKKYPPIPPQESDIYVVTVQGDRLDLLANTYYKDPTLWWVISIANTGNAGAGTLPVLPQNTLVIPEGVQIRIPNNPLEVYNVFNQINS